MAQFLNLPARPRIPAAPKGPRTRATHSNPPFGANLRAHKGPGRERQIQIHRFGVQLKGPRGPERERRPPNPHRVVHGSRFLTAVGTLHGPMCAQRSPTYVRAYVRDRGGTYARTYVGTAVAEDVAYL